MQRSRSETGRLGEELTAYYLQKSGYEIVRRNFRIKGGEIDIIAFVEVKTRDISALESGAEAVKSRKRSLIINAAREYSYRYPHDLQPRFDISEVTVKDGRVIKMNYLDNAYDGDTDSTL